jgi:hypothetical protein
VTALTVGVTAARFPECKRGLAVNLAASLARDRQRGARVCVVDADPATLDVTTRLAVPGPVLQDFAGNPAPSAGSLGSVHEPPLWVLPGAGSGNGRASRCLERALQELRDDFDVVICDLPTPVLAPGCSTSPGGEAALDGLDWLLVAVTPDVEPVAATTTFLAQLDDGRCDNGPFRGATRIGVVTTGDEASTDLAPEVVARALRRPVLASVPQLWGRARPNLGFGAALGIAELDDAVAALFDALLDPIADADVGVNMGPPARRPGFEATRSRAS